MLAIPPASDSAIKTILSSIINGFLAEFSPEVRSLSGPVVLASVDAYNRCVLFVAVCKLFARPLPELSLQKLLQSGGQCK